jgi:hypothetical protein
MTNVRRSIGPATNGAEPPDYDGPAADQHGGHPGDEFDPADGWTGAGSYAPTAADGRPANGRAANGATRRAADVHARTPLTGQVELVRPVLEDVQYIARNMRERDRAEIFATRWDDDPDALAASAMEVPGSLWVVSKGGTPVALFGARPMWPGVWCAYAFGTDHWPEVVLTMTRHIMRFIIPSLTPRAHLVVAFCHEDHVSSMRWLRRMGAEPVSPMLYEWGRERENFVLLGWRA